MPKAKKPKSVKIGLAIQIEGEQGMEEFARMLVILHNNGYQSTVRRLVGMLVAEAKKTGAAVPASVEAFANVPGQLGDSDALMEG